MKVRAVVLSALLAVILGSLTGATDMRRSGNLLGVTHLNGDGEVPPVATLAQGQAVFTASSMDTVAYRLNVAKIRNVTQAHIHCGEAGVNGPVVVFLFGFVSGGVTVNGILAEGSFTNANIIPRPDSAACPGGVGDLEDLIDRMRTGRAYVNVHTVQNPGGEVRGQIATPSF